MALLEVSACTPAVNVLAQQRPANAIYALLHVSQSFTIVLLVQRRFFRASTRTRLSALCERAHAAMERGFSYWRLRRRADNGAVSLAPTKVGKPFPCVRS